MWFKGTCTPNLFGVFQRHCGSAVLVLFIWAGVKGVHQTLVRTGQRQPEKVTCLVRSRTNNSHNKWFLGELFVTSLCEQCELELKDNSGSSFSLVLWFVSMQILKCEAHEVKSVLYHNVLYLDQKADFNALDTYFTSSAFHLIFRCYRQSCWLINPTLKLFLLYQPEKRDNRSEYVV